MSLKPCCPNDNKPNCFTPPVAHLFRRATQAKDPCEPVFGLQETFLYYRGCFSAVFIKVTRDADRVVAKGNPPLDITDIWLIPGSTRSGFVVTRSWRLGNVTFYEVDEKKMPSFNLSVLDQTSQNLVKRIPGVIQNEKLLLCGDKK